MNAASCRGMSPQVYVPIRSPRRAPCHFVHIVRHHARVFSLVYRSHLRSLQVTSPKRGPFCLGYPMQQNGEPCGHSHSSHGTESCAAIPTAFCRTFIALGGGGLIGIHGHAYRPHVRRVSSRNTHTSAWHVHWYGLWLQEGAYCRYDRSLQTHYTQRHGELCGHPHGGLIGIHCVRS